MYKRNIRLGMFLVVLSIVSAMDPGLTARTALSVGALFVLGLLIFLGLIGTIREKSVESESEPA